MIKKLSTALLFLFLKMKYALSNKRGEGHLHGMITEPINYLFAKDNTEKYAVQLNFLNILKEMNQLSDREYSNIKAYLKGKYKVA